jgi:L-threonylcarbamoyladenylate synthase
MVIFDDPHNKKVLQLLQDGAVGIIPTDTLYGIVCRAADEAAVQRLYAMKDRHHKPGTIVAASIDQFVELGIPRRYLTAVKQFWPNAISIETPHDLAYLHQGTGRQALRIPKDESLRRLLEQTGPLQTTSANLPDEPVAETIEQAIADFGEEVDFYVDGGDLSGRPPSTIIRIVDDAVEVVREGAVRVNEKGEIES